MGTAGGSSPGGDLTVDIAGLHRAAATLKNEADELDVSDLMTRTTDYGEPALCGAAADWATVWNFAPQTIADELRNVAEAITSCATAYEQVDERIRMIMEAGAMPLGCTNYEAGL